MAKFMQLFFFAIQKNSEIKKTSNAC